MDEMYQILSNNMYKILSERLVGIIETFIDEGNDMLSVTIRHNSHAPFHFNLYEVSARMSTGITAEDMANLLCAQYRKYVTRIYFKECKNG